jgi:cyanophycinase
VQTLTALLGSGEYLPVMDEIDRHLLAHCPPNPKVICLPTAAGQESEASWMRWNRMGAEHFQRLGVSNVHPLPVIDRQSAENAAFAAEIESANLIYFSGGNPRYLHDTLNGSAVWQAAQKAWARGAGYAGCSAGAMILGEKLPDFRNFSLSHAPAFGWIKNAVILPHFDRLASWRGVATPLLQRSLSDGAFVLGIDEETALVGTPAGAWKVMGRQSVHIIHKNSTQTLRAGQEIQLS